MVFFQAVIVHACMYVGAALRRATTTPLLPSATSFEPNTGTAQPQLTRHAPPHTCRYWGSRMDPDCVFSCLLRADFSPTPPTILHGMQGFRLTGLLTGLLPLVAFCILKQSYATFWGSNEVALQFISLAPHSDRHPISASLHCQLSGRPTRTAVYTYFN